MVLQGEEQNRSRFFVLFCSENIKHICLLQIIKSLILSVTEKAGPEKYQQIWYYISMCFEQSSHAYKSNCHIIYLSLAKDRNDFHKIVFKM